MTSLKSALKRMLPKGLISHLNSISQTLRNYRILSTHLGQYRTIYSSQCVDSSGSPIPWYSYPAIEYIKQLDFTEKSIFEYGSGNSSRFWADRCKQLVSIENNQQWYDQIRPVLPENVEYQLIEDKEKYIHSILSYPDKFDLIIIDGSHRYECAKLAIQHLKDDGFIILDNSDWENKTASLLRSADLIEVDMAGFGPINGYTWSTSFFFSRSVSLTPLADQPVGGTGSETPAPDYYT